jgi:adenosylmethionine-8-amino-7-oxononanoate aminotransferase
MISRHGSLMTGHTFSGHTAACAAGVAVQTIVERDHLLDKVKQDGAYFMDLLRGSIGERPYVGDIRGRGFFIGIELVADRPAKEPFDPSLQLYAKVRDQAFANGLICYPAGGNVDGIKGDQVILAPPYNASRAELDEIADKLQKSLAQVITALPKKR